MTRYGVDRSLRYRKGVVRRTQNRSSMDNALRTILAVKNRQEMQLQEIRKWRCQVARFPWLYHQIGTTFKLTAVMQWLLAQRARFGNEMFLCSGGVVRYRHVLALGGFPDVRITQDYFFFTEAIVKFKAVFLPRETAGYGVGNTAAIWNPLSLYGKAKLAHINEWKQEISDRQEDIRRDMGNISYHVLRIFFKMEEKLLNRFVIPFLDRRGYFEKLYYLTDPEGHPEKIIAP